MKVVIITRLFTNHLVTLLDTETTLRSLKQRKLPTASYKDITTDKANIMCFHSVNNYSQSNTYVTNISLPVFCSHYQPYPRSVPSEMGVNFISTDATNRVITLVMLCGRAPLGSNVYTVTFIRSVVSIL